MKQVKDGTIGEEVYKCFRKRVGEVSPSEKLAWRNSLRNMYSVLNNELIPDDVGVFIEYILYRFSSAREQKPLAYILPSQLPT